MAKKGEETVTPFFIQGQACYNVPVSSRKVVISLRKLSVLLVLYYKTRHKLPKEFPLILIGYVCTVNITLKVSVLIIHGIDSEGTQEL